MDGFNNTLDTAEERVNPEDRKEENTQTEAQKENEKYRQD